MHLRTARLCLDCDEVHQEQQCPACASETFTFLTRWVPLRERTAKSRPRGQDVTDPEALDTYNELLRPARRRGGTWRSVGRGALGLALFGLAGWAWRHNSPPGGDGEGTAAEEEGTTRPRS